MSLFKENPKSIFDNIKKLLTLAVKDRHHTFHTPVFSNKNQNNSIDSQIPEDGIPKHLKKINSSLNESEKSYPNFVVNENKIQNTDWLYLASSSNRR